MSHPSLIVAAIDFGTTFSGYAFSFRHEYETDPLRVRSSVWSSGSSTISLKTSSTVLFKPDGVFDSFGFEAEDRYSELAMDEEHRGWYYFRRFKMMLYNSKDVHRDTTISDESGKKMPARDVFSAAIRFLKDHLNKTLSQLMHDVDGKDIKWVLTVPAIWDDGAKQFMREAAEMAGIKGRNLCLALEPEAASMFCKSLPLERMKGSDSREITCFQKGSKYLVLDAGGGTVDITVHEVAGNGKLRELHKATGGCWGGTTIDKAFLKFLEAIIGPDVLARFKEENQDDFIDMMRDFEVRKRTVEPRLESKVTFRIPIRMYELYEEKHGQQLREAVRSNKDLSGKVTLTGDKMRVEPETVKELFKQTCTQIVEHISGIFADPIAAGVSTILMVGGFSESPMLQTAIKTAFPTKNVITPHEAGLAVLKGAVIFGHNSGEITSRIAKYTYGLKCWSIYEPSRHPRERMIIEKGEKKVRGTFSKLVEVGESVSPDKPSDPREFCPVDGNNSFTIKLYASPRPDPIFVDEGDCCLIGEVEVYCGRTSGADVSLVFGGTELEVIAVDKKGQRTTANFNFLD